VVDELKQHGHEVVAIDTRGIPPIDINSLFKFIAKVLPSLDVLWDKMSFEKKKVFQVFGFPKGVVFDGENFRTPEICSVFKLKEIIDGNLLPIVPYQLAENNTLSTTNFTDEQKVYMSQEFWIKITEDLKLLKNIAEINLPSTTI
jgi:hypothetical protein